MSLRITPIDDEAAEDGVWINYRGVDLCVARANNEKFKNTFLRLSKGHRDATKMSEKQAEDLLCKSMSCNVLTNWKNFAINGDDIEFNKDNCYNLLIEDVDCRMFVLEFAQDVENYIQEEHAETAEK